MIFTVASTGRVVSARIARSSGFRTLDMASLGSMSRCRFRPASVDGTPVQGNAPMQYVWTLE
jgi:protein TonB